MVVGQFDNFPSVHPESVSLFLKQVAIGIVELVAMPVPFVNHLLLIGLKAKVLG